MTFIHGLLLLTVIAVSLHAYCPELQENSPYCAVLYKDAECNGQQFNVSPDTEEGRLRSYSLRRMKRKSKGSWSDSVSSVQVRSGCTLTLYDNDYFGARSMQATRSVSNIKNVQGDMNDKASSYKCYCV